MLKIKNLLSAEDLFKDDLLEIIDLAEDIMKSPDKFSNYCNGKLLGTLFLSLLLEQDFLLNQQC